MDWLGEHVSLSSSPNPPLRQIFSAEVPARKIILGGKQLVIPQT
jgi:hypothetical protein